MKRAVACILLGAALVSFAAEPEQVDCSSASDCIAQAERALRNREWRRAEDFAAFAVDWAEPVDAKSTFVAYRLAALGSHADGRPRMALEWVNAGADYPGPWDSGKPLPQGVLRLEGRTELQQLVKLWPALIREVSASPSSQSITGTFVKRAGRGLWDELKLAGLPNGQVHWVLSSARNGGGTKAVRERGPAQMFEGEGDAQQVGSSVSLFLETMLTRNDEAACTGSLQIDPNSVTVSLSDNCWDYANTAGVYVRVED